MKTGKFYKLMGCLTCTFFIVGIVFYIILMINSFSKGVDWLTGFFLIYGAVGILMHAIMIPSLLFCMGYKECHKEDYCNY